ncbi:hypothetical protein HH310_19895 [Actinoplanes sp. TBRC 11911]|uniref:hypothetical protein n=1 Tax=Actinoplanes sp. TBRC 11911 TaxID=2729386 RepID=UPI00145C721A|nr:hypothetical protein [Actinoplanes sp. TBRC 11911]NMO53439.1 hypothetical protein [Actinoplanes sp. TBRC 11911]
MLEALDDNILSEIARIACGDDGRPLVRRTGNDLAKLLQQAGWQNVPRFQEPRRNWLTGQLRTRRNQPGAVEAVVKRLADRREYVHRNLPFAAAQITEELNKILAIEDVEVAHSLGRPTVRRIDHSVAEPADDADTALHTAMTDLVRDPALAAILQNRLNEARICERHGAWVSAVIMLGSLLEGVLLDAAAVRLPHPQQPPEKWTLSTLIQTAHQKKWIQRDARGFLDPLRQYRNSVHPNVQPELQDPPDKDTLAMCRSVVNATLNDLAATAP